MKIVTALLMFALAACSGDPETGIDDEISILADAAVVTCSTATPPDGGATYNGIPIADVRRCGAPNSCPTPICWWCTDGSNGAQWTIAGNECHGFDAGTP